MSEFQLNQQSTLVRSLKKKTQQNLSEHKKKCRVCFLHQVKIQSRTAQNYQSAQNYPCVHFMQPAKILSLAFCVCNDFILVAIHSAEMRKSPFDDDGVFFRYDFISVDSRLPRKRGMKLRDCLNIIKHTWAAPLDSTCVHIVQFVGASGEQNSEEKHKGSNKFFSSFFRRQESLQRWKEEWAMLNKGKI